MKKPSKAMVLLATLAICAGIAPAAGFAAEPTTIEVGNSAEFDNAVTTVNAATSGEYIIKLTDNLEGAGATFANTCPTTILGNGHTMTLGQYSSISVQPGAQLSLGAADGSDTLKISGGNAQSNDVPGLLYIQGACNMYPGVTVADRKGENYFGGGVTVQGGTFHMYGGTIDNCGITGGSMCYGGGVAVIYGGSFTMDGGEITNCFATSGFKASDYGMDARIITSAGGGVYVSGGSSFVMNGGTISNNKANEMGGGVALIASIDEIVNGGWGNLQSSAQILGGTISENEANDGAGVLASAYFYAAAYGLCADTPNVGAAEKPGLFLENATITKNTANQDEGYGAGVLAVMLKTPAAAEIRSCTITENIAALGGGIASYGNFTSMVIDRCTITGNKATNYGGGFAADSNSGEGAGTTITDTKLCNNTAGKAASDIYLDGSPLKLAPAKDMNALYQGKPDDVTNKKIDGWFVDGEELRYTAQTKEQRVEYTDYANISADGKVYLIAAAKPSLVKISFANEDGSLFYSEDWYEIGTKAHQITVPTPTKPSDDKYDYVFESWHKEITDATEDVVYKAQFKKVPKGGSSNPGTDTPGGNKPGEGDKPGTDNPGGGAPGGTEKPGIDASTPGEDGTQPGNGDANADATSGNAKSDAIPSTGDMVGTVGALFLLAGCIALAGVIIAAKKRKRNAK